MRKGTSHAEENVPKIGLIPSEDLITLDQETMELLKESSRVLTDEKLDTDSFFALLKDRLK